jgi:hypothetical protein
MAQQRRFEYPQSVQPPMPPTFVEFESERMKGRLLLHARFPLIPQRERLHKWFATNRGKGTPTFDPRVALVVVSIQQAATPLDVLKDEVAPDERISRLKMYVEITPTEDDVAFFHDYEQTIEAQPQIVELRQKLADANNAFAAATQRLNSLCAADTETIEVPTMLDRRADVQSNLSCTFAQLEGLIRTNTQLNRGKKNRLITKQTELLKNRRAAISRANGINIGQLRHVVGQFEQDLEEAIAWFWTSAHEDILEMLKEAFADMEVLGPGLEADGFLKQLAWAITNNNGNAYSLDKKRMSTQRPKSPAVAHSLYISLDALMGGMRDENHNIVYRDGAQVVFAPYAKGAKKGPRSNVFNLIGSIVVACETSQGGVYAVRLCPEVWQTILINAERLRASGIVDHLLEDWSPVVVSAETGNTREQEIAAERQAVEAHVEPEGEQPDETTPAETEQASEAVAAPPPDGTGEDFYEGAPPVVNVEAAPAEDEEEEIRVSAGDETAAGADPLAVTPASKGTPADLPS